MLGPGLALRGQAGSVERALLGMRRYYAQLSALFLLGSYSFFGMVVALTWFEYFSPSGDLARWSWLCFALQEDGTSKANAARISQNGARAAEIGVRARAGTTGSSRAPRPSSW